MVVKVVVKEELYEHWKKNAPKLMFGEHQLSIELNEVGEFFIQKAKEELRETPEVVAESLKELKKLLAGNKTYQIYCIKNVIIIVNMLFYHKLDASN